MKNGNIEQALRDASREHCAACDQLAEVSQRYRDLAALAEDLQQRLRIDTGPTADLASALAAEDPVALRARLTAVREDMRRIEPLVERAKAQVSATRRTALRELGKGRADAYRDSVRALALAAIELGRQLERHRAFERDLPGGGPDACGLPPISRMVGDGAFAPPVDALSHTRWGAYVNLALRLGAIRQSDIPSAWLNGRAAKSA